MAHMHAYIHIQYTHSHIHTCTHIHTPRHTHPDTHKQTDTHTNYTQGQSTEHGILGHVG